MKKVITFFIVLLLNINSVFALNMVSLGDSIPAGYGLSNESDSFIHLLEKELKLDLIDYVAVGMNTDDLVLKLKTHELDESIKSADIITLTIGSNDFLSIAEEIMYTSFNNNEIDENNIDLTVLEDLLNNLNKKIEEPSIVNELEKAVLNFEINFDYIINYICDLNSTAKIYVTNIYNPYFDLNVPLKVDLTPVYNFYDSYVIRINKIISSYEKFNIIDLYHILRNNNLTNVNPLKFSIDPHPNKVGHVRIYEALLNELTYEVIVIDGESKTTHHVLKGDKLNLEEKTKKGYKFVKWDHDLDKIDSNIEIRPIYKKNINYTLYIGISMGIVIIISLIIVIIKKKK